MSEKQGSRATPRRRGTARASCGRAAPPLRFWACHSGPWKPRRLPSDWSPRPNRGVRSACRLPPPARLSSPPSLPSSFPRSCFIAAFVSENSRHKCHPFTVHDSVVFTVVRELRECRAPHSGPCWHPRCAGSAGSASAAWASPGGWVPAACAQGSHVAAAAGVGAARSPRARRSRRGAGPRRPARRCP